jgi:hypothetical protein
MLLLASEYGDVFSHNIAAVQKYWRTAMSRLREEPTNKMSRLREEPTNKMSRLREEPNKYAHATAKTAQVARYRLWRRLISARRPCIAEQ